MRCLKEYKSTGSSCSYCLFLQQLNYEEMSKEMAAQDMVESWSFDAIFQSGSVDESFIRAHWNEMRVVTDCGHCDVYSVQVIVLFEATGCGLCSFIVQVFVWPFFKSDRTCRRGKLQRRASWASC